MYLITDLHEEGLSSKEFWQCIAWEKPLLYIITSVIVWARGNMVLPDLDRPLLEKKRMAWLDPGIWATALSNTFIITE